MLALQNFIKENPDWEDQLKNPPFCLKINRDCGVIGFNYNQIDSSFSLPIVQESRGVWLYGDNFSVACHSFDKFFNYGEPYADKIDWSTSQVQEKIDGSIMKVWFNRIANKWMISTNGTINAENASTGDINLPTFYDVFMEALKNNYLTWEQFTRLLRRGFTYTFELVSPQTRVVIPYDKADLYFIGIRSNITNKEVDPDNDIVTEFIKRPSVFPITSLDEVIEAAAELPWDEEGYVAVDKYYHRVKIKSTEWIKAHYARSNNVITKKKLIEIILNHEQDEFLVYAADYAETIKNIEEEMLAVLDKMSLAMCELMQCDFESRRDYAEKVKTYPSYLQPYLFAIPRKSPLEWAKDHLTCNKWEQILEQVNEQG